jgi:hypothetical protein
MNNISNDMMTAINRIINTSICAMGVTTIYDNHQKQQFTDPETIIERR